MPAVQIIFPFCFFCFHCLWVVSVLKFMRTDKTVVSSVGDSEAASLGKNPKYFQQHSLGIWSEVGTAEIRDILTNPRPSNFFGFAMMGLKEGTRILPKSPALVRRCSRKWAQRKPKNPGFTFNTSSKLVALKKPRSRRCFGRRANNVSGPQNNVDTFAEKTMFNISLTAGWAHIMMERAHDGNRRTRNWPAREKWTV